MNITKRKTITNENTIMFDENEAKFVELFASHYKSGNYKETCDYDMLDDEYVDDYINPMWRMTDMNKFRETYGIGYSVELEKIKYFACPYDPFECKSPDDQEFGCELLQGFWDEDNDWRDMITCEESMFTKIYGEMQKSGCTNLPPLSHFFVNTFAKIGKIYGEIVGNISKTINTTPINELVKSDWFTFDQDARNIINTMIRDCISDPSVCYTMYEKDQLKDKIHTYNVKVRNEINMYMWDSETTKYVNMPEMDVCVDIFWEQALGKPLLRDLNLEELAKEHYIVSASSYNDYKDCCDILKVNIGEALEQLEIDHRFKVALDKITY